jgi:hypothetical protein
VEPLAERQASVTLGGQRHASLTFARSELSQPLQ